MTRETPTGLHVRGAHSEATHPLRGGLKPPTDRNLGLTPAWHISALAALAGLALALALWSMGQVDPLKIDGAGLVRVLPPLYFVGLGLCLVGFVGTLSLRRLVPLLLIWQLAVTIIVLHGADPIIHGLPRLEASYRHLGIADAIHQAGRLDPGLDAYFNWPGFFSSLAMLTGASGVNNLTAVATWAPVGVNLLLLAPLLALAKRLTANPRQAWAAVWVFYLCSWVGQDYLSPQAFAFLLMVALFAVLLSAFHGWAWPPTRNRFTTKLNLVVHNLDGAVPRQGMIAPSGRDLTILIAACSLILLTLSASHQLTPFAIIPLMAAMLLIGRVRLRYLPVLAVLLPVAWLLFPASTYLSGHLTQLFGSFGNIGANTFGAVSSRVAGSDAHMFVVYTRMAEVALVWLLAALGALAGYRRKTPWLAAAAGAIAPLMLIPAQPYGGELLLRLYLFSLPFAACLVVLPLLSDRSAALSAKRALGLLLMGSVLAGATVVSRYGNDGMESFSAEEIKVVEELYATAPEGSILIEAVRNTPWRFQHYADYDYRALAAAAPVANPAPLGCDAANQIARKAGAYLIITNSQLEAAGLLGITPPGDLQRFAAECGTSPGWSKVYENTAGVIFHIEGAKNAK